MSSVCEPSTYLRIFLVQLLDFHLKAMKQYVQDCDFDISELKQLNRFNPRRRTRKLITPPWYKGGGGVVALFRKYFTSNR